MLIEKSSQTAGPATSERGKKKRFFIYAPTSVHQQEAMRLYAWFEEMLMLMAATYPIFLRLYIELFANPGQRMDRFGQH